MCIIHNNNNKTHHVPHPPTHLTHTSHTPHTHLTHTSHTPHTTNITNTGSPTRTACATQSPGCALTHHPCCGWVAACCGRMCGPTYSRACCTCAPQHPKVAACGACDLVVLDPCYTGVLLLFLVFAGTGFVFVVVVVVVFVVCIFHGIHPPIHPRQHTPTCTQAPSLAVAEGALLLLPPLIHVAGGQFVSRRMQQEGWPVMHRLLKGGAAQRCVGFLLCLGFLLCVGFLLCAYIVCSIGVHCVGRWCVLCKYCVYTLCRWFASRVSMHPKTTTTTCPQ